MATLILITHTKPPCSCSSCNIEHFTGSHNNNLKIFCLTLHRDEWKILFNCYTDNPYQLINDMDFICVLKKNPIFWVPLV